MNELIEIGAVAPSEAMAGEFVQALALYEQRVNLSEAAITLRDRLLCLTAGIVRVSTPQERDTAVEMAGAVRKELKAAEAAKSTIKRPVDRVGAKILDCHREFADPLTEDLNRIGRLVSAFTIAEEARVRREEADRQRRLREAAAEEERLARERAAAQAKLDATGTGAAAVVKAEEKQAVAVEVLQDAARVQIGEPTRSRGQITKTNVGWEITDAAALYAVRKEWFDLTPKRAVISGSVKLDTDLPGLKVWPEVKTSFRGTR